MKKRKLLSVVCSAALATAALVGCGGSDAVEDATVDNVEELTEEELLALVDVKTLLVPSDFEGLDFDSVIKLEDFDVLETLNKEDYQVTEEAIQEEIDYYLEAYGTASEITDRAVANGDAVIISFVGTIDGEELDGALSDDYYLEIGSGQFIDGFEDGLIGVIPGETVELDLTFPEDYEEHAGADVLFTVEVHNIVGDVVNAEYTDELVTTITGGDYDNKEDFEVYIDSYIKSQLSQQFMSDIKTLLVEKSEIIGDIQYLVDAEYANGLAYYEDYAKSAGYSMEDFAAACGYDSLESLESYIAEDSEAYVIEKIAVYAYTAKTDFTVSDEDYMTGAQSVVDIYGYDSIERLLLEYEKDVVRFDVFTTLLSEYLLAQM